MYESVLQAPLMAHSLPLQERVDFHLPAMVVDLEELRPRDSLNLAVIQAKLANKTLLPPPGRGGRLY